jgi:hypothetical protein
MLDEGEFFSLKRQVLLVLQLPSSVVGAVLLSPLAIAATAAHEALLTVTPARPYCLASVKIT